MAAPSVHFRPRPIDIASQIPVIHDELDETVEAATGQAKVRVEVDVPTPDVKIIEDYDQIYGTDPFEMPRTTYIRTEEPLAQELDVLVEYDLEPEDLEWLSAQPRTLQAELSPELLEFMIDRLEKEAEKYDKQKRAVPKSVALSFFSAQASQPVIEQVWNFWNSRRSENKNRTLLRRFIKAPRADDPDPRRPFRPRSADTRRLRSRVSDNKALNRLKTLREEFDRARLLLELIKKREKLKKERILVLQQMIETQEQAGGGLFRPLKPLRKRLQRQHVFLKSKMPKDFLKDLSDESESEDSQAEKGDTGSLLGLDGLVEHGLDNDQDLEPTKEDLAFPIYHGEFLHIGKGRAPVRARARLGRGGRIIFDREIPTFNDFDSRQTRPPIDIHTFLNPLMWESEDNDFTSFPSSLYTYHQPLESYKRQKLTVQ